MMRTERNVGARLVIRENKVDKEYERKEIEGKGLLLHEGANDYIERMAPYRTPYDFTKGKTEPVGMCIARILVRGRKHLWGRPLGQSGGPPRRLRIFENFRKKIAKNALYLHIFQKI